MQEKGWSSPPVVGATADSAENEKTDPNKGHMLEDIGRGLQSAARNIEDEIPKSGSAIGNMFKHWVTKIHAIKIDKEKASNKLAAPPPKDRKRLRPYDQI